MTCLLSVLLPAKTSDRDHHRMSAAIVATRTLAAYLLGAALRGVALHGSDYRWEGISVVQAVELEAVVQAVVSEVACQSKEGGSGERGDLHQHVNNQSHSPAREILSRADVQRALDALIAALLIHARLTGCEAAEIILTAFAEE